MHDMYNVCIVDDEPFIIEGLYDLVDWPAFGLQIVGHASHGKAALDVLAEQRVDILVTDISMPVMDGLELIREARRLQPELKVIILSGFNEFEYLKEGMKLGIENYLLKPINVEELESTLRNAVSKLHHVSAADTPYDAYGMQILKDNIFHRWLNGQIAIREFEERTRTMNLSLPASHFAVAILRAKGEESGLFARTVEQLANEEHLHTFRDQDGDVVVIANLNETQAAQQAFVNRMTELSERLIRTHPSLLIGAGSLVAGLDQASTSYQEAKRALQYVMIYPELRVIDHAQLAAAHVSAEGGRSSFSLDWKEYAKLMLARNTMQLADTIRADFEHYRERATPAVLRSTALELVIRFKMELESIRHAEELPLFEQALRRITESETFDDLVSALQQVGTEAIRCLQQDMKNPIVAQVLQHIDEHYAEELSLKLLGAKYHLHPVYLGQLFQKETGETFAEYINKYRIERAKEQLRSSNRKVHEIARNVGYWETGYFYKQFRKYVGISPTDFKVMG
ncbi:Regulator of RpoS [Paenibacillus sp. JJ-223]|nr:Regulator of RpoS [Paenibacillus sp. JJ-223]